ncbi:MAG: competence/damage-inducible protein A [Kiritimatiellae bacterium]|nr:competence/damage-inducible protein A [Kiritimatiellia bacterium]
MTPATAGPSAPRPRRVEMVATGSELLNGRTINRHSAMLARYLAPLGCELVRETTVPDDKAAIVDALRGALERVDTVFVTGGLGPTPDDITRDAVAEYCGRGIVMDEPSREHIRKSCEQSGRDFSEARQKQALVVEGAVALRNEVGAAPGERLELGGKLVFLLPGPPSEFESVLSGEIIPWLRLNSGGAQLPPERIFMTSGIAEAEILAKVEQAGFPPDLWIAYCAAPGRVEVRLTMEQGGSALDEAAATMRGLLGEHVFAEERVELEAVVGRLLAERRHTLAAAESCTGGMLGQLITSVSGSSDYYVGGVVAYSNDVKIMALDVDAGTLAKRGAVSADVAMEMAAGVRKRLHAHYGIGITGIAGPAGGTPEKPVGLVYICVADAGRTCVQEFHFTGGRERIREWSCQAALDMLRRRVLGIL